MMTTEATKGVFLSDLSGEFFADFARMNGLDKLIRDNYGNVISIIKPKKKMRVEAVVLTLLCDNNTINLVKEETIKDSFIVTSVQFRGYHPIDLLKLKQSKKG